MIEFLYNIVNMIESSGFFFAPILAIAGLLNLSAIPDKTVRKAYLLITGVMMLVYLIFGSSARYTLIPLLLFGVLSAAGTAVPVKYWQRWSKYQWRLPVRYLLVLMTVITVCCSALKLAQRHRSAAIQTVTRELRGLDGKFILCSVDCSQGIKIGGLLMHKPGFEFKNFEDWPTAMDFLSSWQPTDGDLYIFTRISKPYTQDDFRQWFRGKYSIYPFDEVKIIQERSRLSLLLKYNGKILDGVQKAPYQNILQPLPDTLPVQLFHHWGMINIGKYLNVDHRIFTAVAGTRRADKLYLRKQKGQLPEQFRLEVRNQLGWLEAFRIFKLTAAAADFPAAPLDGGSIKPAYTGAGNSVDVPLVLEPELIFVPTGVNTLFWSGAIPLWQPGTQRFTIDQQQSAANGQLECRVYDRYLQTTGKLRSQTVSSDVQLLTKTPQKICLIQDQHSSRLRLAENLPDLLHPASSLQVINLTETAGNALLNPDWLQLPNADSEVIILNIFADALARPWTVPLMVDPYLDEFFSPQIRQLQQKFPNSRIGLILPPPAAPGENMYPYCDSPQLSRLAHYHICSALQRWYRRNRPENIWLVPLYLSCHPLDGYTRYAQNSPIWNGYDFTGESQKLMAETTGTFLVYSAQQQRKITK